jgi:hypothetical protein
MKTIRNLPGFLITMFLYINSFGQPCSDIHNSPLCRIPAPSLSEYKPSSYSKSALLDTKIPYKYSMVLHPGTDYLIGVCCDSKFKPVKFRLIDLKKDTVLYDNVTDDYMESIGFAIAQNPLDLVVEVTVMAPDVKPQSADDMRCCVGISILYRSIVEKGFY